MRIHNLQTLEGREINGNTGEFDDFDAVRERGVVLALRNAHVIRLPRSKCCPLSVIRHLIHAEIDLLRKQCPTAGRLVSHQQARMLTYADVC